MSEDYTEADFLFKIRKAFRYGRLYGVPRTLVKIRGQFHGKATQGFDGATWVNLRCKSPNAPNRSVAIVGCGNFAFSGIAYYLRKWDRQFLRATFDTNRSRARSLCENYGGLYAAADWREILDDTKTKTVFIASNHASHAEYAVACIEAGKHVHIEKPHVVTRQQLAQLISAMKRNPHVNVNLGFNRPRSPLFIQLRDLLAREPGPLMINWFVAAHHIPDNHWYFNEDEGGRVLGNLCHWTDLTLHLVGLDRAFPCEIVPATPIDSKSNFVVSIIFSDQSCASITFSAKGHTFEGVREVLNVHKGNVLASLIDFRELKCDIANRKVKRLLRYRDHGHEANILHSVTAAEQSGGGETVEYVEATARFFLAIREAIDNGETVTLS